jgi:TPR repeat protein
MRACLVALCALLYSASLTAADFDTGCAAFDRGDYGAAREEWAPLAKEGHAKAQFRLGCLYTFGQGVPEDHEMALRLFRLAADQGDLDGQNNLGGMYAEGLGAEPDLVQAYMWFEIAAARGHEMAKSNRSFIGERMSAEQIGEAKGLAAEWRKQHAAAGN